ncbi:MAG: mechanosensitive ion channel [Chitinivibrionales bacterium]|nr:mechanosensitive ion channel [Chitinivibrionales bacterium]
MSLPINASELLHLLKPVIIFVCFLLSGIIFEKLIVVPLRNSARTRGWNFVYAVSASLPGLLSWGLIGGGFITALEHVPQIKNYSGILDKILLVYIILIICILLTRLLSEFVNMHVEAVEGILASPSIFVNLGKIVIFVMGVLIVLQSLKISITPILTALGVGGLAVALALQDTLSNFFSGLQIIASKQVKPGDYVKLVETNEEGYVSDITWRNTTIKSFKNNMTIVPNSKLATTIVTNYYQPIKEMKLIVQVGVHYDSELEHVERVTVDVAENIMKQFNHSPSFKPFIRYHTFSDSSINFNVILQVAEYMDHFVARHEFVKQLHRRYKQEGIVIPFPIRTVYMASNSGRKPHDDAAKS